MNANLVSALPGAAAMTFLILLAMHALIGLQPAGLTETRDPPPLIFTPQVEERDIVTDEPPPDRINEVEPPPPLTPPQEVSPGTPTIAVPKGPPLPRPDDQVVFHGLAQDGPLVVMVRVQPTYPVGQIQRGIEGYVVVEFDVLPDGTVGNIRVIESSSRAFERSAIEAASRFRYKARVVDGVPQLTTGVRYRFRFEMDR